VKKKIATFFIILLIAGIGIRLYYQQNNRLELYNRTTLLMDTVVDVKVYSQDSQRAEKAVDLAFERGEFLAETVFDYDNENSQLAYLNRNAGKTGKRVRPELLEVLKMAVELSEKTNGAFDVTAGALKKLWNFEEKPFEIPASDSIQNALGHVNYNFIKIHGDSVFIEKTGTIVDLGAIAKGYIADEMLKILEENNVEKALVNAGGEVALYNFTNSRRWGVAVQHPRKPDEPLAIIDLESGAVATSGDYERFFVKQGKRYHHILNPKTGYPADSLISVTILSENAALADMLSTAVFVLGEKQGLAFIENYENCQAILVNPAGKVIYTKDINRPSLRFALDSLSVEENF
jgi:thiamine biosynthesis lipoprotein